MNPIADMSSYRARKPPLAGDGGGPHDGDMQERVAKLEETMTTVRERLIAIETTLGHLDRTVATKGELSSVESTLIKWFIATAVALSAITFAAAKFLH